MSRPTPASSLFARKSTWLLGLPLLALAFAVWPRSAAVTLGAGREEGHAGLGDDDDNVEVVLRAPRPKLTLAGPPSPPLELEPTARYRWLARSIVRDVAIYNSTRKNQYEIGGLRLGSAVRARPARGSAPCKGGWFEIEPRGYACISHGLRVGRELPPVEVALEAPDKNAELPFRYVHVQDRSVYLYGEPATAGQREAVRGGDEDVALELRARSMDGGYFLAVEGEVSAHDARWARTLHGNYVLAEATRTIEPSALQGSHLRGGELPLAFVVKDRAPVLQKVEGMLHEVGVAERYARLPLRGLPGGDRHVQAGDGRLLLRQHVRVARRIERPDEVPNDARWVHIHLGSQTLVAYRGDTPRFATLVSTGLAPRETPTGVYQVHYKYVSTTMRGEDETGPFEVQEVPWTMYYERNYAMHGAYWHDAFGAPRSHGCTNMAPLDARWLFHFVDPELPQGWQRSADIGTYVVVTGETEDS